MGKKPKVSHPPHGGKFARVDPQFTRPETQRPSWVFAIMDMDGQWSWSNTTQQKLLEIRQTLASYESMDWKEILLKSGSHSIATWKLCKEAQQRLAEIRQDDVDDLICLRKTGRERIWGIKDRDVLKLLWWDPEHSVYPVEKQNT